MPAAKTLTCAERKAALVQRADTLIEHMLDWSENTPQPHLTPIEDVALDLRQQFGQALSQDAIAAPARVAPIALPACPQCAKTMRPKGLKPKTVLARVGELKIERSHFYCPTCERGLFPPRCTTGHSGCPLERTHGGVECMVVGACEWRTRRRDFPTIDGLDAAAGECVAAHRTLGHPNASRGTTAAGNGECTPLARTGRSRHAAPAAK